MKGTVICMPSRKDSACDELIYNGVDFEVFDAITKGDVVDNIANSFKQVIRDNYEKDSVLIFEDDIKFSSSKSVKTWEKCVSVLPEDCDILLGGCYTLSYVKHSDMLLKASDFRSLHCVLFNKKCYDKVLAHKVNHLDYYLSTLIKEGLNVYVCNPMIAIQKEGYSFNKGKEVNYSRMLKDFNILYD